LKPDPRDKWAFYLIKSLELLNSEEVSDVDIPPPPLTDPSKFSPSIYVVLINSCWVMSLGISLSCILFASVPRRWARRYSNRFDPRPRSRLRRLVGTGAFIDASDDDGLLLPWLVETLPTLMRASLYLFFAGFGVLVFNLTSSLGTGQALLLTAGSLICPILCFQHP
jgi:hypothetical protein